MNIKIGRYQFFTGPFYIGFNRFENGLARLLEWNIGLGWLHITKWNLYGSKL